MNIAEWKKEVAEFCHYGPTADTDKTYVHFKNKIPSGSNSEYEDAVKWLCRTLQY